MKIISTTVRQMGATMEHVLMELTISLAVVIQVTLASYVRTTLMNALVSVLRNLHYIALSFHFEENLNTTILPKRLCT